jgi:hypothetical protein
MDSTTENQVFVEIAWHINPFRGDMFLKVWLPAAEAALDYGASYWALLRAQEGGLEFRQQAVFPTTADFDRYWYSAEIAEKRIEAQGLYQVPLLPEYSTIVGAGAAGAVAPSAT